jgi:hypothetical protein
MSYMGSLMEAPRGDFHYWGYTRSKQVQRTWTRVQLNNEVEVKVTLRLTVSQPISQYVLVSSPLWDLWPDITFYPKVIVWKLLSCLRGTPSLTRGRVCHLSFLVCSNLSVFTWRIYVSCALQFSNVHTIYTKLLSVPARYSRLCSTSYYWNSYKWAPGLNRNLKIVNSVSGYKTIFTVRSQRCLNQMNSIFYQVQGFRLTQHWFEYFI